MLGETAVSGKNFSTKKPTVRELEILAQIANGKEYTEISRQLCITPRTVKHHTASLLRKLEARNRAHLIAIAFRSSYLQ